MGWCKKRHCQLSIQFVTVQRSCNRVCLRAVTFTCTRFSHLNSCRLDRIFHWLRQILQHRTVIKASRSNSGRRAVHNEQPSTQRGIPFRTISFWSLTKFPFAFFFSIFSLFICLFIPLINSICIIIPLTRISKHKISKSLFFLINLFVFLVRLIFKHS